MKQTPVKVCITAANGKMGKAIQEQIALCESEFQLVGTLTRSVDDSVTRTAYRYLNQIPQIPDVIIDFSRPEFAVEIATQAQQSGVAFVSGTTGFSQQQLQKLQQIAEDIPVLWAANMSLGVNLALELVRLSSLVLGEEAQVEISEAHHAQKVDAPSGTALALGEKVALTRKKSLSQLISFDENLVEQNHPPNKIGFNVIREGEIIGEHTVSFNLAGEQLNIEHKATDRKLFAAGSLRAAKWLVGQSPGWYQMREVLDIRKHLKG